MPNAESNLRRRAECLSVVMPHAGAAIRRGSMVEPATAHIFAWHAEEGGKRVVILSVHEVPFLTSSEINGLHDANLLTH